MDQNLLEKYFRDECTEEELEKVLEWFETEEGQNFLERDIEKKQLAAKSGEMILYAHVESKNLFNRIQRSTDGETKRNRWLYIRVASVVLIITSIVSLLYWNNISTPENKREETVQVVYRTEADQHKILTFEDGTKIRLNENSLLTVPENFTDSKRQVELDGEAYFEVAHNSSSPFIVETAAATIEVLGTKFNVLTAKNNGDIQVAVSEGKVALTSRMSSTASALLTENHLGILRLSDQQITIEKVDVRNYLSWISNRLVYTGESLSQVSTQLERLYNIHVEFETENLKHLNLTADIGKIELPQVLQTIANTFDIQYKQTDDKIVWVE